MKGNSAFMRSRVLPLSVWLLGLLMVWEAGSWMLLHVAQTPLAQSKLPYVHEVAATLWKYSGTLVKEGELPLAMQESGF